MKKGIRLTAIFIALAIFTSCLLVACDFKKEDDKDKKYDVAIKVKCSDGKEWIFQPGTDELYYEYDYDGIERTFWVSKYNLVNHPQWGDKWFDLNGSGANTFTSSLGKVNQMYYEEDPKSVCEKGKYYYSIQADATSNLWNFRSIRLFITVK